MGMLSPKFPRRRNSPWMLFPLVWKTGHNHAGSAAKQVNRHPVTGLTSFQRCSVHFNRGSLLGMMEGCP